MRIKPWYVQIQQNRVIFLQVYVNLFEYWLLSKFSHLTARQNKSRPGGEIFRIWTRGNYIFFPVKRENYFIWTAPELSFSVTPHDNSLISFKSKRLLRLLLLNYLITTWNLQSWHGLVFSWKKSLGGHQETLLEYSKWAI